MNPGRARLLVVDDSRMIRRVLIALMQKVGFTQIDEAANGLAALELFQVNDYDLVLTDWTMPGLDGIELLRMIRHSTLRSDTPVVLFTGDVSAKRMIEALDSGANGFVAKPFVPTAVCEKVLRIIATLPPVSEPASVQLAEPRAAVIPS